MRVEEDKMGAQVVDEDGDMEEEGESSEQQFQKALNNYNKFWRKDCDGG